jgi:membrane-bound lytic murein transglycosylase B
VFWVGRGARATGRGLATWARTPGGRFVLPALLIGAVLMAAGTAGRYAVPLAAPAVPSSAPPSAAASAPDAGQANGGVGGILDPTVNPSASGADGGGAVPPDHPQAALAGWAQRISPAVGIPVTALAAYGYAALRTATDHPSCHLAWTTLAGIGKAESDHGRDGGSIVQPDGRVLPPIIGAALDGRDGRKLIADTDHGVLDGDNVYDRAVGPMQFLPSAWQQYQVDADRDGVSDPNDLNDASLAAATYLCAGGKDLATNGGWWAAVLSYNTVQAYAQKVFDAANDYGQRSRTVA